ncbi:glyoxalase-like protein [Nocardiopsis sp. Huas11]|uniref:VOC family protein n=1 Tax=Nocardiopsis sp. Huas11 TaxID=2183912 RepID=UPI000F1CFC90|nr:VOC family protein [Nocardiopsis sp. Huas11]RKS04887.1 glyoxalase-like protein [Nocardiopsis sp. Huas11]
MIGIDHLVYATPDLAATRAEVERRLGVPAAEGGRHLGKGSRNVLWGLGGDAYLEVVGPDPGQPDPDGPRPFGLDGLTAPALVTWATAVKDMDAALSRIRALGYDPGHAEPMSRRTPEGELLEWRLTRPAEGGVVPFLIDWGDTVPPGRRGLPQVRLVSFTAAHDEPARVERALGAVGADLPVERAGAPGLTAVLEGPGGRLTLR